MLHGRGLVIDQNREFIDELKDGQDETGLPLVCATTLKQGLSLLRSENSQFTVAFVSTTVPPACGMEAVKEIKQLRPNIPIIMIDHYDFPRITQDQVDAVGCLAFISRPQGREDLLKPIMARIEAQTSWKGVAATPESKNTAIDVTEKEYIATPVRDFFFTPKSFFNLYIRINAGKLLKVLNAGDVVEDGMVKKYLDRGVHYLYIREEEQNRYINLCDKMVAQVIAREGTSASVAVEKVLHLGENVTKGLYQCGITGERLHFASSFLQHTEKLSRMVRMGNDGLTSLVETMMGKDHVSVMVMISGLLAMELGFESHKAVKMVGLGALFHDIGLYDLLPHLEHENPEGLSPEERALWEKHPARGEAMLRAFGGFEEVVYQSVAQHHLRRRGDASKRRTPNINMVSEIIGLSDEFQNAVLEGEFSEERMSKFVEESLPLFTPAVAEAFLKVMKTPK